MALCLCWWCARPRTFVCEYRRRAKRAPSSCVVVRCVVCPTGCLCALVSVFYFLLWLVRKRNRRQEDPAVVSPGAHVCDPRVFFNLLLHQLSPQTWRPTVFTHFNYPPHLLVPRFALGVRSDFIAELASRSQSTAASRHGKNYLEHIKCTAGQEPEADDDRSAPESGHHSEEGEKIG